MAFKLRRLSSALSWRALAVVCTVLVAVASQLSALSAARGRTWAAGDPPSAVAIGGRRRGGARFREQPVGSAPVVAAATGATPAATSDAAPTLSSTTTAAATTTPAVTPAASATATPTPTTDRRASTPSTVPVVVGGDDDDTVDLATACGSGGQPAAVRVALPAAEWARLRGLALRAAAASASSRFPIRESLRLFRHSRWLADAQQQRRGRFIVSSLPLAFGADAATSGVTLSVPAAAACAVAACAAAAAAASAPSAANASHFEVVPASAAGVRAALALPRSPACDASALSAVEGALFPSGDSAVRVRWPCGGAPMTDAWQLLLAGALADAPDSPVGATRRTLLRAQRQLACGAWHALGDVESSMDANVGAAAAASVDLPSLTRLMQPDVVAGALRNGGMATPPGPGGALPLHHPDIPSLAAAAAANDTASLLAALVTPSGASGGVLGVLTAVNVIVSPRGLLQSTAELPPVAGGSASAVASPANFTALQHATFDAPAAEALAALRRSALRRFAAGAVGGADVLDRALSLSPRSVVLDHWPAYAGRDLDEQPSSALAAAEGGGNADGGLAMGVASLATTTIPETNGQLQAHPADVAVTPWDDALVVAAAAVRLRRRAAGDDGAIAEMALRAYDEVLVLPPPADDSYLGFATGVLAPLALALPYLRAHPHVRVHVPYYLHAAWAAEASTGQYHRTSRQQRPHAMAWLAALEPGLPGRLVTGRVVARLAHLLDRPLAGPRVHPLHVLALRQAAGAVLRGRGGGGAPRSLRAAGDAASATTAAAVPAARPRDVLVVLRPNTWPRTMTAARTQALLFRLAKEGLNATVLRLGPAEGEPPLGDVLAAWASASAVVGVHGSSLVHAAALRPGSLLVEMVPFGGLPSALAFVPLAHVARVRHAIVALPGSPACEVGGEVDALVWLLCGQLACAGRQVPPPDTELQGRLVLPPQKRPQECLSPVAAVAVAAAAASRAPLTAAEPYDALVPFTAHNFTVTRADGTVYGGLQAWLPPPSRLALKDVVGIAIVQGTANTGTPFLSRMPFVRPLLHALEARRLLPVAVPLGLAHPMDYQSMDTDCTANRDLAAVFSFASAAMAAVAAARGLPPSTRLPVVSFGLSSGSMFTGVLAAHLRLEGAIVQLDHPERLMTYVQTAPGPGRGRLRPLSDACLAHLGGAVQPAHRDERGRLRPEWVATAVPPMWETASLVNEDVPNFELLHEFLLKHNATTRQRLPRNAWLPAPLCAGDFHAAAPWLVSPAAGRALFNAFWATGLVRHSDAMDAAVASMQPHCPSGAGAPSPLHYCAPPGDGPPTTAAGARGAQPISVAPLTNDMGSALEHAVEVAFGGFAYVAVDPPPVGAPLFYFAAGDPLLAQVVGSGGGAVAAAHIPPSARKDCVTVTYVNGTVNPAPSRGEAAACERALGAVPVLQRWLHHQVLQLFGNHEWHESTVWEGMVAQLAEWAGV